MDPRAQSNAWQAHLASVPEGQSKNAAKKAAKRAYFESTKADRRAAERLKKKEKRKAAHAEASSSVKKPRVERRPVGTKVVIDCGFDALMTDKEVQSMAQQLMYCYASNRGSTRPLDQLVVVGQGSVPAESYLAHVEPEGGSEVGGEGLLASPLGRIMEGKMRGVWRSWKQVKLHDQGGLEALPSQDLVYLTADAEETLTALDEKTTYVIGGIVDKNRYKNLCATKAQRLGIRVAKLPISQENLEELEDRLSRDGMSAAAFSGRKVLTVNQVVDILVGWNETRDWVQAIGRGLPKRKFNSNDKGAATDQEQAEVQAENL